MKAKIAIVAFAVAVIASFSFITINKKNIANSKQTETITQQTKAMSGFTMEDEDQF